MIYIFILLKKNIRNYHRKIVWLVLLCCSLSSAVFAANTTEVTTSFTVDANYRTDTANCNINVAIDSPNPMQYNSSANGTTVPPQLVNGYITFANCGSPPYSGNLVITTGNPPATSGKRQMLHESIAGMYLPYDICVDSSCTTFWAITDSRPITCTATDCKFTFYLQVPLAAIALNNGYYYDMVPVTFSSS